MFGIMFIPFGGGPSRVVLSIGLYWKLFWLVIFTIVFAVVYLGYFAKADPLPNGAPAVNTAMPGCIEGRAIRWLNGSPGCTGTLTPPTVSACGTAASVSPDASDYAGLITIGTGIATSCKLTFGVSHVSPALACIIQNNNGLSITTPPTVTTTDMTFTNALSMASAKVAYICFAQ